MKIISILIVIGIISGFIFNFYFGSEENNFSKIEIEESIWNIEVASSLKERVKGLSSRNVLEKNNGLLFIFPNSDFHGIWMKEMNFSIDIIWFDENLNVVGLKEEASPDSYPEVFLPKSPVKYILEINSGEAKRAGIKIDSVAKIF